jgi:hypothetical protein
MKWLSLSADEAGACCPLPCSGLHSDPTNAGHEQLWSSRTNVDRTEKGLAGMPLRKLIFLSGLVLAVVAMTPAAAMGAAKGPDRPVTGTLTVITTVNLNTGAASNVSSGQLSHLGTVNGSSDEQFSLVGANGFSWTGTGTIVAANGDNLFETISGVGTFGPPMQSTRVDTITGGTGRFADASGTFTYTSVMGSVSIVGSTETVTLTSTINGTISY